MGSSSSSLSKRKALEDDSSEYGRLVLKKPRFESLGNTDVVVSVGGREFEECSHFLRLWSGYFEDEWKNDPEVTRFDFPDKNPIEWELLKSVLYPFSNEKIDQDNYHVLLPWFAELRCEAGLVETDDVILSKIVEPLLAKDKAERTPVDVNRIVTVLEHCVAWNRTNPRDRCILFLRQVLKDLSQPFEGQDILRIVILLTKDEACQKVLWKLVKSYLPADLVENASFPTNHVNLVADNPLLLDVIVGNMKLKKYLYLMDLKLNRVLVVAKQAENNKAENAEKESKESGPGAEFDSQETVSVLETMGNQVEVVDVDVEVVDVDAELDPEEEMEGA